MIAKRIAQALRKAEGPSSVTVRDFEVESGGESKDLLVTYYQDGQTKAIDIQSVQDVNTNADVDIGPDDEARLKMRIVQQ